MLSGIFLNKNFRNIIRIVYITMKNNIRNRKKKAIRWRKKCKMTGTMRNARKIRTLRGPWKTAEGSGLSLNTTHSESQYH